MTNLNITVNIDLVRWTLHQQTFQI